MEVRQILGGRYQLLSELGTGGMAVVWRARDEVLGRPVAVKLLAGRFADDPQSRSRIRDEARAAATLSHPNIAQVYDYGESTENGTPVPYVVMELINGPTLQQRVADGPLPARTVFRICGEVAAGLAAAHADGLVHRDIKMANIMVTAGGAKVVDFGIAAAAGPAEPGETLVGTPAYLAPERLAGAEVQPASDVYALGVLLFRLLAGQPPWSVESTIQMLEAHVHIEPDPLPDRPGVPPAITDLVARCLRKDPASRPSAATVSATLADAAEASHPDHRVRDEHGYRPPASGGADPPAAGPAVADDALTGDFRTTVPITTDSRPMPADKGESTGSRGDVAGVRQDPAPEAVAGSRRGAVGSVAGRAVEGGPAFAVVGGAHSVRSRKRKSLLAAGGAGGLIVAGLVGWSVSSGDPDAPERGSAAAGPSASSVVTPARTGGSAESRVSVPAGAKAPAATSGPRRSAGVSGSPAPSRSRTRSAGPVAVPTATPPLSTTTPLTSPPTTPPPAGTRLTSPGGSVRADCGSGGATLSEPEPEPGFDLENIDSGPTLAAEVVFAAGLERYRMTVTCVAGVPTPVVLPL